MLAIHKANVVGGKGVQAQSKVIGMRNGKLFEIGKWF